MSEVFRIPSQPECDLGQLLDAACDHMEAIYRAGRYSKICVVRHWSHHNPTITGKVARPAAYRWYLRRELFKLAAKGAQIDITPSQERMDLTSPALLAAIDDSNFDQTRKKLFLFGPERVELSLERLEHYTGTRAEDFQRYVLLTNYHMHMSAFQQLHPEAIVSNRADVQMPTMHHLAADHMGLTIINIGVGPSNAKNLTDHLAVLRPDAMLMIGHCAGIRNHQEVGDFVLASSYMRDDHVLDDALPRSVPVTPSFLLNRNLARVLEELHIPYRIGVVYTTADRNWELAISRKMADLKASRSIGVDMESATVAANGFRYRIPSASLLCISDKPLHGRPKLPKSANDFYQATKVQHLQIAETTFNYVRATYPDGLPNSDLRAMDEPLVGGT